MVIGKSPPDAHHSSGSEPLAVFRPEIDPDWGSPVYPSLPAVFHETQQVESKSFGVRFGQGGASLALAKRATVFLIFIHIKTNNITHNFSDCTGRANNVYEKIVLLNKTQII